MKHILLFFLCSTLWTTTLISQDDVAMQKAWMDYMTPGDMHKWLAKSDGNWTCEIISYWDPGNPTTSKVMVTNTTIYNGLYQVSNFKGDMGGMAFEGQGVTGYDNAKKQFVSTWMDNMGSGIIYMTGQFDPKTNILHLKGNQSDPMSGKDSYLREEFHFTGDDSHVISLFSPGMDGKEMKMMDIKLTRVK